MTADLGGFWHDGIFRVVAAAAFSAFYGCYFVKMISQKRRGIRTNHLGRGKRGLAKFVEAAVMALACIVFAAGLLSILFGAGRGAPIIVRAIGAAATVAGTSVFICAVLTMRDSWRAGVPEGEKTSLVTDGIYKISRNPAFLGFDLLYVGTLLMFFSWILFALTVLAVAMFHLQIVVVEEAFMAESFGDGYLRYKERVRRYFGRRR